MPRYHYVVLARPVEGGEQEFDHWYDTQHLADVKRVPGVISAQRFNIAFQKVYDLNAPAYRSMAIYEIETDDPEAFLAGISQLGGTDAMPLSTSLSKVGMIQIVGSAAVPNQ